MTFEIIEAEQRSDEWYAARAGRITGSRACDILAKIKTGEAAARRDYRFQLAVERITGKASEEDQWLSKDVQRGRDLEPMAFAAYEAETGNIVRRTGFLRMTDFLAGCSLDGDINEFEGIIECKCPKPAIHVGYIRANEIPRDYMAQINHNLWVTGAKYCDFVSYCEDLPERLQFLRIRVERDEAAIAAYVAEASRFLAEVSIEVKSLSELRLAA